MRPTASGGRQAPLQRVDVFLESVGRTGIVRELLPHLPLQGEPA